MKIILTVDVGNSRAKFGLFESGSAQTPQVLSITAVRLCDATNLAKELQSWIADSDELEVSESIVSGSNPPARDRLLKHWPITEARPRVVSDYSDVPLQVNVDEPKSVGIDRLLTGLAARQLVAPTQSVIVIDSGTATTVNLISADNTFQGGAILPGLRLSAHALHDYTARLPMVDADQLSSGKTEYDAPVPGRNTLDAIKAGLFWGQLGAVKELSARLQAAANSQFGDEQSSAIVLTGGGGRQLVSHLKNASYIDSLTLHGLALLADDTTESD